MKSAVFAKHLQGWPLAECCDRVKAAGFDGLDLTVRPGGFVDPDIVAGGPFERRFTEAVRTVRAAGLEVPLITTGLVSAVGPARVVAEQTLGVAGSLGIPNAKLHYWPSPSGTPLPAAVDGARRDLTYLAKIAEKSGVRLNLHNHSGDYVTCQAAAVADLVKDHDPKVLGVYLDPAHYTLEGGLSGWRFAVESLAERVVMVAVKDARWVEVGPPTGVCPQERRWVPVGTGNVRWTEVFAILKGAGWGAGGNQSEPWCSIHGEYQGRWSWRDLSTAEVLAQCEADRGFIATAWGES